MNPFVILNAINVLLDIPLQDNTISLHSLCKSFGITDYWNKSKNALIKQILLNRVYYYQHNKCSAPSLLQTYPFPLSPPKGITLPILPIEIESFILPQMFFPRLLQPHLLMLLSKVVLWRILNLIRLKFNAFTIHLEILTPSWLKNIHEIYLLKKR